MIGTRRQNSRAAPRTASVSRQRRPVACNILTCQTVRYATGQPHHDIRTLMAIARRLSPALLLLLLGGFAAPLPAAEDVLPPGEAFRYAITDTGRSLEID